jgi:hypothetical protein
MLNITGLVRRLNISFYLADLYRKRGIISKADAYQNEKELWLESRLPEIQERVNQARKKPQHATV